MTRAPTRPARDDARRWWDAETHALRRPILLARNRIRDGLRAHFSAYDFLEIETAALQVSPGNETHLMAFATELSTGGVTVDRYLHTSPEFSCKKLLAAGEPRFFTLQPSYRNGEFTALHAPEFAMLEWYEADRDFDALLGQIEAVIAAAANAIEGAGRITRGASTCDLSAPCMRITVADAMQRACGIDVMSVLDDRPDARQLFATAAEACGLRIADDDDWSDIFSKVMTAHVEPTLGHGAPTLLTHYPASEAALARLSDADPRTAERVELYVCGVELANGFAELADADEIERRFDAQMQEMERRYGRRYPIDREFLAALRQMPPAIGCALGFDRLVMLLTGAPTIHAVTWTPATPPASS